MAPVTFFNRTYDETLALLQEARDYVAAEQPAEVLRSDACARGALLVETSRLVARITQIMAWLMVQKAVVAGEMTRREALAHEHRLGGRAVCLDEGEAGRLPSASHLNALLDRSRHLYIRVARLDELQDRDAI
jgi:regulator of CtrA degradation